MSVQYFAKVFIARALVHDLSHIMTYLKLYVIDWSTVVHICEVEHM